MNSLPERDIQKIIGDNILEQTPLRVAIEHNLPEFVEYLLQECNNDPNEVCTHICDV